MATPQKKRPAAKKSPAAGRPAAKKNPPAKAKVKLTAAMKKILSHPYASKEVAAPTAGNKRNIVHGCIQACAGTGNFSKSQKLKDIPAPAECVQACVIQKTGVEIIVSDTDSENDIVNML